MDYRKVVRILYNNKDCLAYSMAKQFVSEINFSYAIIRWTLKRFDKLFLNKLIYGSIFDILVNGYVWMVSINLTLH